MKIGITIGDINGIGPEIIIKALKDDRILKHFTPIIYGSSKIMAYHKNIVKDSEISFFHISEILKVNRNKINIINCWEDNVNITIGKATEEGGRCAIKALEQATQDLKTRRIDALVTAPINKAAMQMAKFPYPGHTEFLAATLGGNELMMMVNGDLKIALATNHLALKDVAASITKELILSKINVFNKSLITDFGIERPTIAVLGLNPHAGDAGAIGQEEEKIIRPAIIESKKNGFIVSGPYSADGFFGSSNFSKVDGILAMYHDQGLVPFKALSFGKGTNFTAGLNYVRTSPDHGTAYDIAGNDQADPSSMREALFTALDIAQGRRNFSEMRENALTKKERPTDNEEEDEVIDETANA